MHIRLRRVLLVPVIALAAAAPHRHGPAPEPAALEREFPSDYFYVQRAMPDGTIPSERIQAAMDELVFERALRQQQLGTSSAVDWTPVGPFAVGGRVNTVVAAPGGVPAYLGSANGGVWRSDDQGANWQPLSDGIGVASIGALALNPQNPSSLWCGSGDANATVDGYDGTRSEEHTSELQSRGHLVCRLLLEKKNQIHPLIDDC